MNIKILSEEYIKQRLAETVIKINRVKRIKASEREIQLAEAERAVWKRVLHHVRNGEMMTIDDDDRIEWHVNAPSA